MGNLNKDATMLFTTAKKACESENCCCDQTNGFKEHDTTTD